MEYNEILALNTIRPEQLPNVIAKTVSDVESIEKKIKESEGLAGKAKQSADEAHKKSAGWSFGGTDKKEAIEALQNTAIDQSNALSSFIDANKMMFANQQKLAEAIRYLFGLGVSNITLNRIVVRELEMRLRNASKEELSDLARQEILNVVRQLRAQEDMINRINGHDNVLREHKDAIEINQKTTEDIKIEVSNFEKSCQDTFKKTREIQESIEQLKKNINASINKLPIQFQNLEKILNSSLSQKGKQEMKKVSDQLESQILKQLSQAKNEIEKLHKNVEESNKNLHQLEDNVSNKLNQLDDQINRNVVNQVTDSQKKLSSEIDNMRTELKKNSFLDSTFYKVIIGLAAIVALLIHLI